MGYVRIAFATINVPVFIKVRDKLLQAKIVKIPFV
jgi:aminomethyltransferase